MNRPKLWFRSLGFREAAADLVLAIENTVTNLESYYQDNGWAISAQTSADALRPLAEAFRHAVVTRRSRQEAESILKEIAPLMDSIGQLNAKGEWNFDRNDALARYYQHHTIFRESRYRGESLE